MRNASPFSQPSLPTKTVLLPAMKTDLLSAIMSKRKKINKGSVLTRLCTSVVPNSFQSIKKFITHCF